MEDNNPSTNATCSTGYNSGKELQTEDNNLAEPLTRITSSADDCAEKGFQIEDNKASSSSNKIALQSDNFHENVFHMDDNASSPNEVTSSKDDCHEIGEAASSTEITWSTKNFLENEADNATSAIGMASSSNNCFEKEYETKDNNVTYPIENTPRNNDCCEKQFQMKDIIPNVNSAFPIGTSRERNFKTEDNNCKTSIGITLPCNDGFEKIKKNSENDTTSSIRSSSSSGDCLKSNFHTQNNNAASSTEISSRSDDCREKGHETEGNNATSPIESASRSDDCREREYETESNKAILLIGSASRNDDYREKVHKIEDNTATSSIETAPRSDDCREKGNNLTSTIESASRSKDCREKESETEDNNAISSFGSASPIENVSRSNDYREKQSKIEGNNATSQIESREKKSETEGNDATILIGISSPYNDCLESKFQTEEKGAVSSIAIASRIIDDCYEKATQMKDNNLDPNATFPIGTTSQNDDCLEKVNAIKNIGIPQLTDKCIERIFHSLHLQDQLRFAQSSSQMESIFKETIITKMPKHMTIKQYEEIKEYSDNEIQQFWNGYGPYFESIDTKILIRDQQDCSTIMYNTMHKYWKNLKHSEDKIPISNTSIFSLDDDCLEKIFNLLKLPQQVRLACCHWVLQNVFQERVCTKMSNIFTIEMYKEFKRSTADEIELFWRCYSPGLRLIDRKVLRRIRFDFSSAMTRAMRVYCVWTDLKTPPSTATIMSLNDDYIEMIFNWLQLHQQIRFAYCHSKFEKIFKERICPKATTHLTNNLYENIRKYSSGEIEMFWRCYGTRLERIDVKALLWNQLDYSAPMYNAMHKYLPYFKIVENKIPISHVNIFALNFDCFTKIFKLLSLSEKVRLARSHSHLERVFTEYIYQEIPPHFNAELHEGMKEFTDDEIHTFWRLYGPYVQTLDMQTTIYNQFNFCMTTYEAMRRYCTNLQRLEFSHRPLAEYGRFFNDSNMLTITEIDISRCNILDYQMAPLKLLPNLVSLGLSYNYRMKGRPILDMRQLKRLSLYACVAVTMETLLEICKNIKLRYLDVRHVFFYNLNAIVEHCGELEVFKFSVKVEESLYENVGLIPKLKSLTVQRAEPIRVCFFYILADCHGHDLEEFIISRPLEFDRTPIVMNVLGLRRLRKLRTFWLYNFNIKPNSNFGFYEIEELNLAYSKFLHPWEYLRIIKSFTKLKRLCTYDCLGLRDSLILEVISILENRAKKSPIPVTPLYWLLKDDRVKKDDLGMRYLEREIMRDEKRRLKQQQIEDNPVYQKARHLVRFIHVMHVTPYNEGSLYEVPLFPAICYKNNG